MIGTRIKLGRMSNKLSLQDLADILTELGDPITRAGLSKYETEKVVPNEHIVSQFADIMDLDISYFYKEGFPNYKINYVKTYESLPKNVSELDAYLQITLEQYISIYGLFPQESSPVIPTPMLLGENEDDRVMALADRLRQEWQIPSRPISSVVSLLEDVGFYVFELPEIFRQPCICGVIEDTGRPFVGFTRAELVDETRLLILRELALFYLDCKDPELLAHYCRVFARAMLLPKEELISDVGLDYSSPNFWELTLLKQKYGISKVEIRHRMNDIHIFTADTREEVFRRKNYMSAKRKLDSTKDALLFSETPSKFRLKVLMAYKKKLISRSLAASLLPKQYIQMNSWDT